MHPTPRRVRALEIECGEWERTDPSCALATVSGRSSFGLQVFAELSYVRRAAA